MDKKYDEKRNKQGDKIDVWIKNAIKIKVIK
jgi:hypothetical protein